MNTLLKLDSSLDDLFLKLGTEVKQICFLNGDEGGWRKLAWDPCDSFTLNETSEINRLNEFVEDHIKRGNLIAGFISYDLGYSLHDIEKTVLDLHTVALATFYAYDNYLEEQNHKIYAIHTKRDYPDNILKLDKKVVNKSTYEHKMDFKFIWDKNDYSRAFKKTKNYIYEGDVYQINLTQRMQAANKYNPRKVFSELSGNNPALMKAYFENDELGIISMSPERFIRTKGKNIETYPIKGTRPRGKNHREEQKNEYDLLNDPKEKAELNMITDLLRNDLGKVCRSGSVKVVKTRAIEKLAEVIHTYSLVTGELKSDLNPFKALLSMFPGGSISGCPKRRALEIIDELEEYSRGVYCGCLAVIDNKGDIDSSILIRTIVKKGGQSFLSVGGGIVNDSEMDSEYQETIDKAKSLIRN